jgi:opacity protein-like surface antigen
MKKYFIILSTLLISLTSANAKSGFYSGIDIQRQALQLKTSSVILSDGSIYKPSVQKFYETVSYNPNIFIGLNAHQNLDIEFGYSMSEEEKINNSTGLFFVESNPKSYYSVSSKSTLNTKNIYFDLKPSYQIDQNSSLYLILGLNYMKFKLHESLYSGRPLREIDVGNYKKNILAPTIGFGYKEKINDNFFFRSQFKYSHINKEIADSDVKLKSLTQLAVGFAYNF